MNKAVFVMVLAGCLFVGGMAVPTPAKAYKVTFTNESSVSLFVTLYYRNLKLGLSEFPSFTLAPKGTKTIKTGSWCPAGYYVKRHEGTVKRYEYFNCRGNKVNISGGLTTCCRSFNVRLCTASGTNIPRVCK